MKKIFITILGTLLAIVLGIFFLSKMLLNKLIDFFRDDFSEERCNKVELLMQHIINEHPKGLYLYSMVLETRLDEFPWQLHIDDIGIYVFLAVHEVNLSETEKVYLVMKYPQFTKYLTRNIFEMMFKRTN